MEFVNTYKLGVQQVVQVLRESKRGVFCQENSTSRWVEFEGNNKVCILLHFCFLLCSASSLQYLNNFNVQSQRFLKKYFYEKKMFLVPYYRTSMYHPSSSRQILYMLQYFKQVELLCIILTIKHIFFSSRLEEVHNFEIPPI